jgi:hypothetical protein
MEKDNFVFYRDWWNAIKELSDEQRLEVYDAIMAYSLENEERSLSPMASLAMRFIKPQLERNRDKYEEICERNRVNGSKGGRPKKNPENPVGYCGKTQKPSGFFENPEKPRETQAKTQKPKKADNDNDNDNDNDSDNDSDIVKSKRETKRCSPPTLSEIKSYLSEKGIKTVDAEKFYNHYTSNGWMVGKNKMKSWKAAIGTWERNEYQIQPQRAQARLFDPTETDPTSYTEDL